MLSLLVSTPLVTYACDVCGGGAGLNSLGLLSTSSKNFIGLNYGAARYQTIHPQIFESDPYIEGISLNQKIELMGRYKISPRFQVLGFVPYRNNTLNDTANYAASGLGDASLMLNTQMIKKGNLKWVLGAGVKLPTGRTNKKIDGLVIPNIQLGTGSTDLFVNSNLIYKRNKMGVIKEVFFKYNTPTNWDYRFGHQGYVSAMGFYSIPGVKADVFPQLGLRYEFQTKDLESHKYNVTSFYSGVQQLNLQAAMGIYFNKLALRMQAQVPLYHHISEGYVNPQWSLETQFIYTLKTNR